jgi:hypothetical protein
MGNYDIGGIEGSRVLEPLALLWISQYFKTGNGNHAFKLLLNSRIKLAHRYSDVDTHDAIGSKLEF